MYKHLNKILHFLKSHLRNVLNKLLSFFGYIRDEPTLTEMLDNHIRLSSEQIAENVKANNALLKQFMDKAYPCHDNNASKAFNKRYRGGVDAASIGSVTSKDE